MSRIVLIDAHSQIYRCFYALRILTNPQNEPVNALFGMARIFLQLDKSLPGEFGALVFDKGKAVKRVAICPEYKAQRPPMPPLLRPQLASIREWAEAFGWPILEQEGFEADDLIAAVSRQHDNNTSVTIVTHDKDIAQLTADPAVTLSVPQKGNLWSTVGAKEVEAKFGVPPHLLGDYLALVGDTSDNITGIKGIGPKTAASLLLVSGGLDNLFVNPSLANNRKLADKITAERELIERNRKLVALDNVLPDCWNGLESIRRRMPDWKRLASLASEQNFKSLLPVIDRQARDSAQETFF